MMKIFVQDNGIYGMICVVESTPENARVLMEKCENYDPDDPIIEYDIKEGLVLYNLGDL